MFILLVQFELGSGIPAQLVLNRSRLRHTSNPFFGEPIFHWQVLRRKN